MHSENLQAAGVLTPDDVTFLAALGHALTTQDRACTAKPVFYQVLQDRRRYGLDPNYCDNTVLILGEDDGEEFVPGQELALKYTLLRDYDWKDDDKAALDRAATLEAIYEVCDSRGIIAQYTGYVDDEEREGCWLTLAGVEQHIAAKPYRYQNPRTYTAYCADPDLKRLLEIVEKFAGTTSSAEGSPDA